MSDLAVRETAIPGLLVLDLPLHGDERGWFKENWQRAEMTALGLPDFAPVQQNMSHNLETGVTRGFHAEPWDKLVSVACGRVFGAWVDLRTGSDFGRLVTVEIGPGTAVFVPRGVANAYQAVEAGTTFSYLVNEHWSADARDGYTFVNLADETIGCPWPIPLDQATLSPADQSHPVLADVSAQPGPRTLVLGSGGQVGRALRAVFPEAEFLTRDDLDLADAAAVDGFDFDHVALIVNAAAWTAVDAAETREGRTACWRTNVDGARRLVGIARRHRATLVHISSDYVFDGTTAEHTEEEPVSPLGVYGASKAAADAVVSTWERHYIVRTSWVIGQGNNFVRTMADLAARGASPSVVNDQTGRLTFADTLAGAIRHLVDAGAPHGTYNVSNSGQAQTWFDIATDIFDIVDAAGTVTPVTTAEYGAGKSLAPRPADSTLDLSKLAATGFTPPDAQQLLRTQLGS